MQVAVLVVSALLLFTLWPQVATTQTTQKPEQLAQKAAESWLTLTDSGKYAETWDEASQLFKGTIAKDLWVSTIKGVRTPLGAVQSRKFKSATYTKSLPGAPDGEYVVIQFDTSFANKQSAVETITPMLDKDGKWRVSGYQIK
jgi:hypothetical protein